MYLGRSPTRSLVIPATVNGTNRWASPSAHRPDRDQARLPVLISANAATKHHYVVACSPGPFVIRVTLAAALVAMVAWVLFTVVFPWVEQVLPFIDASVAD
jgi:hypothetical protein